MACGRCQKKISEDDHVVCQGYCGASFHAVCVNVDEPLRVQLHLCGKNLFWMCTGCAELFSNNHFRSLTSGSDGKYASLPSAVESMQGKIEKLHSALQALSEKVDAKPNAPTPFATPNLWPNINRPNPLTISNTPKRLRSNSGLSVNVNNGLNRTGTEATNGIRTVRLERLHEDDLTWIYLSAFHPSTSEGQISSLAKECLGIVQPLIPKQQSKF